MNLLSRVLLVAVFAALGLTARAAFAIGVTGGDIPLPSKTVAGKAQLSWNGSYAELLAADALAECWTTQQDRYLGSAANGPSDAFFGSLKAQMSAASCKSTCATPPTLDGVSMCPFVDIWLDGRKDSTCNIDASSGLPKALDVSTLRATSQTAAYQMPTASGLGMSGTGATAARSSEIVNARETPGVVELVSIG
jgi:hypothetical protein